MARSPNWAVPGSSLWHSAASSALMGIGVRVAVTDALGAAPGTLGARCARSLASLCGSDSWILEEPTCLLPRWLAAMGSQALSAFLEALTPQLFVYSRAQASVWRALVPTRKKNEGSPCSADSPFQRALDLL